LLRSRSFIECLAADPAL